jgi:polyisoprenoid-binding protein YceI
LRKAIGLVLFAFTILPATVSGEQIVLELDPAQTEIHFTLADVLHTVHGAFSLTSGTVRFDPETQKAGGEVVVGVLSGVSGSKSRDRKMQKDVLESPQFPDAVFTPDRVDGHFAAEGTSELEVHGLFRIHGAAHELVFHAHVEAKGNRLTATLRSELLYTEWGIKNPSTLFLRCSDKVQLDIQTTGKLRAPTNAQPQH